MSAQEIPNLSQFSSEGDNGADALCWLAVVPDGISVRVWMCSVSGLRSSQTPRDESCHLSGWELCLTEDGARSPSPWINRVSRECPVLCSDCDLQRVTAVLPSVASAFLLNTETVSLLRMWMSCLTMSEKDKQGIRNSNCCGTSNKTSELYLYD